MGMGSLVDGEQGVQRYLVLNDSLRFWASNLRLVGSFEGEEKGAVTQVLIGSLWLQSGKQTRGMSEGRETWQEFLAPVQVPASGGYPRVVAVEVEEWLVSGCVLN